MDKSKSVLKRKEAESSAASSELLKKMEARFATNNLVWSFLI